MMSKVGAGSDQRRFGWITRGEAHGPDEVFDRDLGQWPDAAVIPTRGAIVPEWLLVVPRLPCLRVADMPASGRGRMLQLADLVASEVAKKAPSAVIFEHGAAQPGTLTGCGVDQAHLHVVGGQRNFFDMLRRQVGEADWVAVDASRPWDGVQPDEDYFLIRGEGGAVRANPAQPVSQRLRQAVSDVFGLSDAWDYRKDSHAANALKTRTLFAGCFSVAPLDESV